MEKNMEHIMDNLGFFEGGMNPSRKAWNPRKNQDRTLKALMESAKTSAKALRNQSTLKP